MALLKQITQSKLLYFSHYQDAITVSENNHFRWLAFGDIVQSLMHLRLPHRLTLPHQSMMLFPLLHFVPKNIIEFGLGGGNITRFLTHYLPNKNHTIIENNNVVIDCFRHYFQLSPSNAKIIHADALQWLLTKAPHNNDWYIYDIYESQQVNSPLLPYTLLHIIERLTESACVSINIPIMTKAECEELIKMLWEHINLHPSHYLQIFDVPHYQNTVIHLIPIKWQINASVSSNVLPSYINKRWITCWNKGITVLPENVSPLR